MEANLTINKLSSRFPESIVETHSYRGDDTAVVRKEDLLEICQFLRDDKELQYNFMMDLTAVDYLDYFEVVYRLVSLKNNQSLIMKTRVYGRDNPAVPSVTGTWRAAYYQEREIFDLLGIKFDGHPDMRRLLLWEGFTGHPLRRDYL